MHLFRLHTSSSFFVMTVLKAALSKSTEKLRRHAYFFLFWDQAVILLCVHALWCEEDRRGKQEISSWWWLRTRLGTTCCICGSSCSLEYLGCFFHAWFQITDMIYKKKFDPLCCMKEIHVNHLRHLVKNIPSSASFKATTGIFILDYFIEITL